MAEAAKTQVKTIAQLEDGSLTMPRTKRTSATISFEAPKPIADMTQAAAEPTGEEFLEFKEALSDLRQLRSEYECLNGGGPGWRTRNEAAWARVNELFADEDEAAYERHVESFYG